MEALVQQKRGKHYLKKRQSKAELARIERELKRLKTQIARLEERKSKLTKLTADTEKRPKKF